MNQTEKYTILINEALINVSFDSNRIETFYDVSYDPILTFFKTYKGNFTIETFYQGLSMIYGWMPTSPSKGKSMKFVLSESSPELKCFQNSYTEDNSNYLSDMISYTNNSMVGLSKLLHFINPSTYPIWDSRIASHFGLKYHYQINKVSNYMSYKDSMLGIAIENKRTLREIEKALFCLCTQCNAISR